MFVVSRRTKYCLKALHHLSRAYGDRWVTVSQIAEQKDIPQAFLANILVDLKNFGILNSERGQRGGYRLRRPPHQITVGSAVRAIKGPLSLLPCASENTHQSGSRTSA
jgi:Rrf2 family protein